MSNFNDALKDLIKTNINIYKAASITFKDKLPQSKEFTKEKMEKVFLISYERILKEYKKTNNLNEMRNLISNIVEEEIKKIMD